MTRLWRAGHCDNRLTNRHGETPHRIPKKKTPWIKNPMSRAFAPRHVLVCARIFRSGAFVHIQRGHDARLRTTEHPRTVCGTPQTNTEMLKQTNKERKATQDVTAPRRKLCDVGKARPHQRIRALSSDAPAWPGDPIHSHRASSKQS